MKNNSRLKSTGGFLERVMLSGVAVISCGVVWHSGGSCGVRWHGSGSNVEAAKVMHRGCDPEAQRKRFLLEMGINYQTYL